MSKQPALRSSRITGTGRFCPEKILTNKNLEKTVVFTGFGGGFTWGSVVLYNCPGGEQ